MRVSLRLLGALLAVFAPLNLAQAIVFFSQGNDHNLTNPGGSLPWDNVVQMRSGTGPIGSGVYLGNRYVLTAAHVAPLTSVRVGFVDYALDSSSAVNIGTSDMKLVRLANDPGLGSVRLNTSAASDGGSAYVVGYGVGRASSSLLNSSPVNWGDDATVAKRWGTNTVDAAYSGATVNGYTSDLLRTQFNTNAGANEAALTRYDSGSALFRQIGSSWYLVGLGAYVQTSNLSGASIESDLSNSGDNYFIRISSYSIATDQIGAVGVPEPSSFQFLMGGLLFLGFLARRRIRPLKV